MPAPRLTASGLWRSELCPASSVLPEGPKRKYRDATKGTKEHAAFPAPPGAIKEPAFAYSVLTGLSRHIGNDIGREYGPLDEGEIPGSLDLLTVEADRVLVQDIKTGVGYMQAEPAINPQLQLQAIAAATFHGKQKALVQLVYTKTGEVKEAEFDALDFAAIHERLATIYDRCTKAAEALGGGYLLTSPFISEMLPGGLDPCWRCSSITHCPLKKRKAA